MVPVVEDGEKKAGIIAEAGSGSNGIEEQVLRGKTELNEGFVPLLPLKNIVALPKCIIPIIVGRAFSARAVEYALKHDKKVFVCAQKDQAVEFPTAADVYQYGTRASILQVMRMPNGAFKILVEGISRAKIDDFEYYKELGFIGVRVTDVIELSGEDSTEVEAAWRQLYKLYGEYQKLNDKAPHDIASFVKNFDDIPCAVDTIALHVNLSFSGRQRVLETVKLLERIMFLCSHIGKEIEILQVEKKIKGRIQTQVETSQREYYLNEQMKAIKKELGREEESDEIEKLRDQLADIKMPVAVEEKAEREIDRLEQMPPMSSEAVISRHYLDWIMAIPWEETSKDTISISQAEKILDKHHAGLAKPKERIIEFLAAKKFSQSAEKSPIICLVGPPGVGKTSLGYSIAESLGRDLVRISLGGVRDEAEIRGHRRTYIGALPGKIIQAMRKVKTINPVILLDEIDKMSQDIHGDPASALLEVLDPEQNKGFSDHFLEIEYDLSKVMFITTANTVDGIPYALLDRMEIIRLSGYTLEEKLEIARKFLIPKKLKEYGLKRYQFRMTDSTLRKVVEGHTREAGVRQLERVIAKLMRKVIQSLLENDEDRVITVTDKKALEWLGNPKYRPTSLGSGKSFTGVVTGLAWTEFGGDVLEVEAAVIPGKGKLTLTGQLGEVMQESAQAAFSYMKEVSEELGIAPKKYLDADLHVHVPEGATPKDGPSAGIAICAAIISALKSEPVASDLAMTGELTLRGRVLAVGGIKEKLLAARRYGLKKIILPKANEDDVKELKKEVANLGLNIKFVDSMDAVINEVFPRVAKGVGKKGGSKKVGL